MSLTNLNKLLKQKLLLNNYMSPFVSFMVDYHSWQVLL